MNDLMMEWRRFEIISNKKEEESKLLKLIDDKNLSREELMLILNTIKIREGWDMAEQNSLLTKDSNLKISFDDYLKSILSKKEIKELKMALKGESGIKTIVIKGLPIPSGKSTLARVLEKKGHHVIEGYLIHEVVLDKHLDNMIPISADDIE